MTRARRRRRRRAAPVSLGTIFWTFLTAGAISFGGGVVAYLREYTVSDTKWLDDEAFLDALEISQTLPGLNAINMSVIIGDNLRGIPGAIVAVAGLVLPGVIIIMGLGAAWQEESHNPQVKIVPDWRGGGGGRTAEHGDAATGHKQFVKPLDLAIIVATFVAVSILRIPLYIVLLVIGIDGDIALSAGRQARIAGGTHAPSARAPAPSALHQPPSLTRNGTNTRWRNCST